MLDLNNPMVLAVLAFLCFAGMALAVGLVILGRGSQTDQRLTNLLSQRHTPASGDSHPGSAPDNIWKDDPFQDSTKNLIDNLLPQMPSLQKTFEQADVNIKPSGLVSMGAVMAVLAAALCSYIGVPALWLPIPALLVFTLPWFWLFWKRGNRLKTFGGQLPDAMELLARALRAGQSLAAGMHICAEEMPEPISKEFGRVYEEQNMGITLEDALRNMCDRVPGNLDLKFFVTAVIIQRQTGGDLAEILEKIGYIIRERFRILGQVKALTAEGRLSGAILLAMPPALFLIVLYLNPDYVSLLWTDPIGRKMSVYALLLQLFGAWIIKKIVDIKV
jgi:tight adherence protein B